MKRVRVMGIAMVFLLCGSLSGQAQQTAVTNSVAATNSNAIVPPLVNFSGTLLDANGRPITGSVAVTFSLYSEQTGGAALWMESQTVQADSAGSYTVKLGATSSQGLPPDLFSSGQVRWLGVQVQGEAYEQPRVMLLSVPYAMKAGDAATVGGLPPSAFLLAAPAAATAAPVANNAGATTASSSFVPAGSSDVTTTGGSVDAIPMFTAVANIQNSILTQSSGAINVAGKFNLPTMGTATSSAGFNSRPLDFIASAFNSDTGAAVNQTFQWQAQPTDNDTASPSGTLNLLFGSGASTPAQTGLHIANTGLITFAKGQTFPGTGDGTITGVTTTSGSGLSGGGTSGTLALSLATNCSSKQVLQWTGAAWACSSAGAGTITGVTAGTDLTGGGTTGSVTLNLDTTKVPLLAAANTFTANQTVIGTFTATSFSGNGSGLSNVTAANSNELGGLASSAFAQLATNNTFTGSVTANSFTGNGSSLTNVTASNSNELGGLAAGAFAQLGAIIHSPVSKPSTTPP